MQDRFRFRVWYKSFGEIIPKMLYDAEQTYDYMYGEPETIPANSFGSVLNNEDEYIVMQCTGLKDKNDKLIYEGDIVKDKCSEAVATIEYLPYTFSLMAHIRGMDDYLPLEDICYALEVATPFEVIGNIYENPELLEVSNGD